jgi:hypothetical protein
MGTLCNPVTEFSAERAPTKAERFRGTLLESLKKHEIQGGFKEIAKTVRNWNSL